MEILIIGLGSIANKHLLAINSVIPNANIFALRSGIKSIEDTGVHNIFNIDEIENKVDFAIISNPTNLHAHFILELAKRNIPMMIEKPSLHSLEQAEVILNLINQNKIFTYVACNLRFHPCIEFIKNYLNTNKVRVNEVSVYCGSYLPDWRPNLNYKEVYSANLNMGGGVHLDLIHELDYTTWLFGKPLDFVSFISSNSSLKIDAPDYCHYLLHYTNFSATITLNYFRKDPKRQIEILLENSTILVDLIQNKVSDSKYGALYENTDFEIQDTYVSQINYFKEKLLHNQVPMNTFEDSLEVLKIALSNE
jgi:predicted dehydrogenase